MVMTSYVRRMVDLWLDIMHPARRCRNQEARFMNKRSLMKLSTLVALIILISGDILLLAVPWANHGVIESTSTGT